MADMARENEDVMEADQILDELRKLAERERAEGSDTSEADASLLDDAIAKLEKFAESEKSEMVGPEASTQAASVVDTGTLTGPIGGLKNFLIKTQRDTQGL